MRGTAPDLVGGMVPRRLDTAGAFCYLEPMPNTTTLAPAVTKLDRAIGTGDWHDAPLRWEVRVGTERQLFSTKREAIRFAGIWRRAGDLTTAIRDSFRA